MQGFFGLSRSVAKPRLDGVLPKYTFVFVYSSDDEKFEHKAKTMPRRTLRKATDRVRVWIRSDDDQAC